MKLAFCLFKYFPYGGLQRDFVRIAKECVRRGHTVDVYVMKWEGEKPTDFSITEISVSGFTNHARIKKFYERCQSFLKKQSYDLVIGFNKMPGLDVYYAADTCFQAKAREQHGCWFRMTPRYRALVANEEAVFSSDKKTKILLIAAAQQAEFQKYYATQSERFHLLPPGIARDRIAPPHAEEIKHAVREEFNLASDQILLLMVGSGFKTKGLDRTLNAIAALPEPLKQRVQLYVIGQDRAKSFLQQAKQLNITEKIKFLGGRNDVARFLLAADLLLHPAYNENTGTVLLEALASGLPVITTDVCGYAHYIEKAEAGIVLASPFKQAQFNQVLQSVLTAMPTEWRDNAANFAKKADIYSIPERAVDYIESIR